jgi:magnesium chelatase subunit D
VPVGAPASTRLRARRFEVRGTGEGAPGRRSRARGRQGRTVRTVPEAREATTLHVPATVLAAVGRGAGRQVARGVDGRAPLSACSTPRFVSEDLRHAVREGREGNLVLFCVDASGSMAARKRMSAVTGAVAALLRDAYQRRDRVGVVTFRGSSAAVALPPTTSVHAAHARLHDLRTGGRTPLADGLRTARAVLRTERTRDPRRRGLLVVLTDGRATASGGLDAALDAARGLARDAGAAGRGASMSTVVVDCESGPVRLGLAGRVARTAGGTVVTLDDLTGESVAGVVEQFRAS